MSDVGELKVRTSWLWVEVITSNIFDMSLQVLVCLSLSIYPNKSPIKWKSIFKKPASCLNKKSAQVNCLSKLMVVASWANLRTWKESCLFNKNQAVKRYIQIKDRNIYMNSCFMSWYDMIWLTKLWSTEKQVTGCFEKGSWDTRKSWDLRDTE